MKITNNRYIPVIVFIVVLLINAIVRWDVVINETLIADDLIYLPRALFEQCIIPPRYPIDFGFICHVVGAKSVFIGRALFLLYISLIATIFYYTLISFKLNRALSVLASVSIFAGIPFLSQVSFITGSYPSHGLFFIIAALYLISRALTQRLITKSLFIDSILIFTLFVLAGIAATPLTLASFIAAPCALYALHNRKKLILWTLIALTPAVSFTILQFTGTFSNHYARLSGWIDISFERALNQIQLHKDAIINWGDIPAYYAVLFVLIVSLCTYTYYSIRFFIGTPTSATIAPTNTQLLVILLGILLAGFVVSLFPTLFVSGIYPRYTAAPLLFIFSQAYILLQLLMQRFPNKYVTYFGALIALFITVTSINSFQIQHDLFYKKLSADQKVIKKFLFQKKSEFAKNAQILIFLDKGYSNFSVGLNHWSTHFARMATNRKDIIAVIGHKNDMVTDPFTGKYSDHGNQYWSTDKDGRATRKRMIGLEKSRPTYIYSLNSNSSDSSKTYTCIAVSTKDNLTIYNTGTEGAQITYSHSVENANSEALPSMENCAFYFSDINNLPASPPPPTPGKLFDGRTSDSINLTSEKLHYPYILSFSFKPRNNLKIDSSYTQTSPPMPLLALPLSVYQTSTNKFTIGMTCGEQTTGFSFVPVSDWSKLSFRVDETKQGVLMINNIVVKVVENCSAPRKILLGQGFKKRFWAGTISDLKYQGDGQTINQPFK